MIFLVEHKILIISDYETKNLKKGNSIYGHKNKTLSLFLSQDGNTLAYI